MPAPKGDRFWAEWSRGYCQVAKVSFYPNRDYGAIIDMESRSVAAMVFRMRKRGLMTKDEAGLPILTEKAEAILAGAKWAKDKGLVAFDLRVRAKSKEEALAEVWDVITQLESWDHRTGEPFKLRGRPGNTRPNYAEDPD